MNLTTFRLRIQSTTGLASATAGHYEQGLVDGWVNEGVEQFLLRTKAVKRTAQLAMTPGQGDYTMDAAILAIEDMTVGERMLQPVDTGTIRQWRLAPGVAAEDGISKYAYEAQVLMLYPTPQAAGMLHMVYVQRPTPMSTGAHDPSIDPYGRVPSEYHPIVEAYAKWKAGEYANDAPSQNGQAWKQEYEAGVIQARIYETRKAGVNVQRARPGWKSAAVGIAPGIDQGY